MNTPLDIVVFSDGQRTDSAPLCTNCSPRRRTRRAARQQ
jgi:hypothetical protein